MLTLSELKESLVSLKNTKELFHQYKAMVEFMCKIQGKKCPHKIEHISLSIEEGARYISAMCWFGIPGEEIVQEARHIPMNISYFMMAESVWKESIVRDTVEEIYKKSGVDNPLWSKYGVLIEGKWIHSFRAESDDVAKGIFMNYLIDNYLASEKSIYGLFKEDKFGMFSGNCLDAHEFPFDDEED